MTVELTHEELEMILGWHYVHDSEGFGDEHDDNLFHKLNNLLPKEDREKE